VGLKLHGIHQLLAYADDVNLLVDNMNNIKKNRDTLIGMSKEVCLQENPKKTKQILTNCVELSTTRESTSCAATR
jgi:hypothetical protein